VWDALLAVLFPESTSAPAPPEGDLAVWQGMTSLANRLLVGTELWPAMQRFPSSVNPPAELVEYLCAMNAANAERNQIQLLQLENACLSLNSIGIIPTIFKGGRRLVLDDVQALGSRYCSDLDLFVPAQRAQEAQARLLQCGYQEYRAENLDRSSDHRHLDPLVHLETQTCIELHRSMVPVECESILSKADQQAMTIPCSLGSAQLRVPDATSALLVALIHSELIDDYIHRFIVPMRAILDVHALHRSSTAVPDWQRVFEMVDRRSGAERFWRFAAMYYKVTGEEMGCCWPLRWRDRLQVELCWRSVSSADARRWSARWERLFPRYLEGLQRSKWQNCRAFCSAAVAAIGRRRSSLKMSAEDRAHL